MIFIHMCFTAHDKGTTKVSPCLYWGGWDELILAIRGDVPEPETKEYAAAKRQVARLLAELREHQAVELKTEGHRGQRAVYRVNPYAYMQPVLVGSG